MPSIIIIIIIIIAVIWLNHVKLPLFKFFDL